MAVAQLCLFSAMMLLILYFLVHLLTTKGITLIRPTQWVWLMALFFAFYLSTFFDCRRAAIIEVAYYVSAGTFFSFLILLSLSKKPLGLFFSNCTLWGFRRDQVIAGLISTFNAEKMKPEQLNNRKNNGHCYLITMPEESHGYLAGKQYVVSFMKENFLNLESVPFTVEGYRTNLFVNELESRLNGFFRDNNMKKSFLYCTLNQLVLIGAISFMLNNMR